MSGSGAGEIPEPGKLARIELLKLLEEKNRRLERLRCCYDLKYLAKILYDPKDPSNNPFWDRYGWPQEFIFDACMAFKLRQSIRVPAGFTICIGKGQGGDPEEQHLEKELVLDLSRFTCLFIMQSRETLKSAIRRVDIINDTIFFPEVLGVPCASALYGHRKEMTEEPNKVIRRKMTQTRFAELFPDIVGENPSEDRIGSLSKIEAANRGGAPEPTITFLGMDQSYEGGRWRMGHIDDAVTRHDRDSPAVREGTKKGMTDREYERDSKVGLMVANGTPWHVDDAWQTLMRQRDTVTIKMPALIGEIDAFREWLDLDEETQKLLFEEYTERCKPVFKHYDLWTLKDRWNRTDPVSFYGQILLEMRVGSRMAFDVDAWKRVPLDQVPAGLPCDIFQDPAMKKPENRYKGDYACIQVWAWHHSARQRFLIDGIYRNDLTEDEYWFELAKLKMKYKPRRIFIEDDRHRDLNDAWFKYCSRNSVHPYQGLVTLKHAGKTNKHGRIMLLTGDFQRGDIVLVEGLEVTTAMEREGRGYDRVSGAEEHDDALDTAAQTNDPAVGHMISLDMDPLAEVIMGSEDGSERFEDDDLP